MGTFGGAQPIVTDGLVFAVNAANYQSYPRSGTTWSDMVGGNDGTLVNGPTFDEANGGGLVFDGSNDYIELGYNENLLSDSKTNEAWVKASTFNNWHGIISNFPSWGTGFGLQIGPIQNIAATVSGLYLKTSWTPSPNTWYHIVATRNSSDNRNKLYVIGVLENSLTHNVSYVENDITSIGCFYTTPQLHFGGQIPIVRIYNRALTDQEVLQNYNALKSRFGL